MAVVLLAPVAARRVRLPGILGLIIAGMVIGPNVLGVLERDGLVDVLGGAGLLFLMFMAGLELDLRASLSERRNDTLLFGGATFVMPLVIGTVALLVWGFEPLAAVLIASCWSSHTLVAYPVFQRLRVVQHRAVATAVGATLITNVAALLVLAVVVAVQSGDGGAGSWVSLIAGAVALAVVTLWALPRLTRWFFAGLGGDRLAQVVYVLTVMFAVSALASVVGIEPIVGAFFAGLGMNEHVPKNGILGERLVFLGDALLIPVFLVSVGMLIDPAALFSGTTIALLALTFAVQSLGGKFLAAYGFGRLRRYDWTEIGTLMSLTGAEAAATLAAIFVGFEVGLFGREVMEAVVLVILATCLFATVVADRVAPRLERPPRARSLGSRVLVPVANPHTAGRLAEFAAALAYPDAGTVVPVNVLGRHVSRDDVEQHRDLLVESEAAALRGAVEASSRVRIDDSVLDGVVHEVFEQDATSILIGWKGYASAREHLFGGMMDTMMDVLDVPIVLCRPGDETPTRRIVVVGHDEERIASSADGQLAREVADRLAARLQTPVSAVAATGAVGRNGPGQATSVYGRGDTAPFDVITTPVDTVADVRHLIEEGDLLVVAASDFPISDLESFVRQVESHTVMVARA